MEFCRKCVLYHLRGQSVIIGNNPWVHTTSAPWKPISSKKDIWSPVSDCFIYQNKWLICFACQLNYSPFKLAVRNIVASNKHLPYVNFNLIRWHQRLPCSERNRCEWDRSPQKHEIYIATFGVVHVTTYWKWTASISKLSELTIVKGKSCNTNSNTLLCSKSYKINTIHMDIKGEITTSAPVSEIMMDRPV